MTPVEAASVVPACVCGQGVALAIEDRALLIERQHKGDENMRKNRMKWLGMLASTGMLFQFGCSTDALFRRMQIGFAESLGAIPGAVIGDLIFDAVDLGGLLGTGGAEEGS